MGNSSSSNSDSPLVGIIVVFSPDTKNIQINDRFYLRRQCAIKFVDTLISYEYQEKIGIKWVNVKMAKPVPDPTGRIKKSVTYIMRLSYPSPGKHIYRLSIGESKKYSGRILPTFTQVVEAP